VLRAAVSCLGNNFGELHLGGREEGLSWRISWRSKMPPTFAVGDTSLHTSVQQGFFWHAC
jgi:hypothetical protein